MERPRIYLDTSIVSFLYAEDEPEKRGITIEFFENYLMKYEVAISRVVILEITRTTDTVRRNQLLEAVHKYSLPEIRLTPAEDEEVSALADEYLRRGVIPPSKPEDALHLAIATVLEYDILLSWNFRHLANVRKQAQVDEVNSQTGYHHTLSLLNPMQVIYEE